MEKVCATCARLDGCRIMDMLSISEDGEMIGLDEMFCSSWEEIDTQKTDKEIKQAIKAIENRVLGATDDNGVADLIACASSAPIFLSMVLKKHARHMTRKLEAEYEQDSKNTARKSS